jgi:hypothetical protein
MITGMYAIYQTILLLLVQNEYNRSCLIQGQQNCVKSVQSKQNYIRFSKQINANTIVHANSKRNLFY